MSYPISSGCRDASANRSALERYEKSTACRVIRSRGACQMCGQARAYVAHPVGGIYRPMCRSCAAACTENRDIQEMAARTLERRRERSSPAVEYRSPTEKRAIYERLRRVTYGY
jgi:hypothetical protein